MTRIAHFSAIALALAAVPALAAPPYTCQNQNGTCPTQGETIQTGTPSAFTVSRPSTDRGAFVTQIGDSESATVSQESNTQ